MEAPSSGWKGIETQEAIQVQMQACKGHMLPHHRTQPRNTEHLPDALGRHHCNAVPTVHTECTRTCMQRLFHWNSCELPDDTQNQRQPFQVRAVVVRKNTYNPTVRSRRRNAQCSSSRCNCFCPDKMSTFCTIHQTTLGLQLPVFPTSDPDKGLQMEQHPLTKTLES